MPHDRAAAIVVTQTGEAALEMIPEEVIQRVIAANDIVDVVGGYFLLQRNGASFKSRCPFHEEKSASFLVNPHRQIFKCFGCGQGGNVVKFVMLYEGLDFPNAVRRLGARAGIAVDDQPIPKLKKKVTRASHFVPEPRKKPALPPMRALGSAEVIALATLRGLHPAGVSAAAADKRVGFCEWPQFSDHHGCWREACAAHFFKCRMDRPDCSPVERFPSWVVTDGARWCAQFRRLDGERYERKDGELIKAWTRGSPTWPLGAAEIGEKPFAALVEGGADMLAAYHFFTMFGLCHRVAIVAMLGAANCIAEDALPYFERKRVRIFMHGDQRNEKTGKIASYEAAARWTEQLTTAGAAVTSFSMENLPKKDGTVGKDLNDLALCDEAVWLDPEMMAAFRDWDF